MMNSNGLLAFPTIVTKDSWSVGGHYLSSPAYLLERTINYIPIGLRTAKVPESHAGTTSEAIWMMAKIFMSDNCIPDSCGRLLNSYCFQTRRALVISMRRAHGKRRLCMPTTSANGCGIGHDECAMIAQTRLEVTARARRLDEGDGNQSSDSVVTRSVHIKG